MTDRDHIDITEDDLHAYLDGQLDPARRLAVAKHLESHPALMAEVEDWRANDDALRGAFAPYATGDGVDLPEPGPVQRRVPAGVLMAAGLAFAFLLGGGAGYLLNDAVVTETTPSGFSLADGEWLAREASDVYLTYVREVRHPVEVGAEEQDHLVSWLGNRIDKPFTAPELEALGFALVGGRLLPIGGVPGAMLMYENAQGDRATILLARNIGARDTAFQFSHGDGVNTFRWVDGPVAYAISGFLDRPQLEALSRAVYDHFEST
ncbi:anti-sigma factor family protein [Pelagibacterium xiamenense]|uniref:anti-sigma factor family protein n=1 Tax=Pelagibacterium xiamenense TaxID=2901140 RepID=UPI001E5F3F6C|nr:anti-sigma factor [Pelagibacterium xiamenense]MCD7058374.1 anti-sigma factor [Pelagibacterium xiamenense]